MAAVLIYLKQWFPSANSTHTNFDILRQKLVCKIWLKYIFAIGRYRDHGPPPRNTHTLTVFLFMSKRISRFVR